MCCKLKPCLPVCSSTNTTRKRIERSKDKSLGVQGCSGAFGITQAVPVIINQMLHECIACGSSVCAVYLGVAIETISFQSWKMTGQDMLDPEVVVLE